MCQRLTHSARGLFALVVLTATAIPALAQYGGAEPDAAWRAQAQTMIDQNRKADLAINIFDQSNNPIPGAQVHVLQTRQAYQFGSAVAVGQVLGTSSDDAIYRQKFEELFNTATIENSLKWVPLTGAWGPNYSLDRAIQTLDYLNARGIENRGHNLVWPGWSNLPTYLQGLAGNPTLLRQEIYNHIDDVTTAVGDRVTQWDVVNEPRTNHDLMDIFGDSILTDIFNRTAADTNTQMYINEYNIISQDGNYFTRQQYLNTITDLQNNGVNLGGIGMQGHFNAGSLTGIDDVWNILDQFSATGVPITITEYDLNTTDETLKADYLRDFLTAVFAHPGTDGFMLWGFWEGRHWRPDAAMFNLDWSETPMAQVWRDLVLNEFMTNATMDTDAAGQTLFRAFDGDHQIEVTYDGQTYYQDVTLTPTGQIVNINLPISLASLPGDLNGDGYVGLDDLQLILDHWNQSVTLGDAAMGDIAGPGGSGPDGYVGLDDLQPVLDHWNEGTLPQDYAAIPEPTTLGFDLMLLPMLIRRRRMRIDNR